MSKVFILLVVKMGNATHGNHNENAKGSKSIDLDVENFFKVGILRS